MPLTPGEKFGPYEIVSPLGAGGMGEVYRARDSRLNRDVALKILPPDLANDPDRRKRFELEARAVAALNHPNIVAVYDVGDAYIVSELVDGEPLKSGNLPLRKITEIAVQIAAGLAAAHDAGIVHRDLKPDNILLTRDGRPKILDFGLAKVQPPKAAPDATVTLRTEAGVVMGTPGYMSPEQVRGLAVDQRSDIFSFGVILHELLSGQRAFQGETAVDTMQAILRQDPPDLPETVPQNLKEIVRHCLEKEPPNRFQSARDLGFALSVSPTTGTRKAVPATPKNRLPHAGWILSAPLLIALVALYIFRPAPPTAKLINASILPHPGAFAISPLISPDGKQLAYVLLSPNSTEIWVRPLDSAAARPLPGTDGASYPFWSPDSRSLAFFAQQKLKRIDLSGGDPIILADAPLGLSGSWSPSGVIIFSPGVARAMERIPATGGTPTALTLGPGVRNASSAIFLPDGRHFTFLDQRDVGSSEGTLKIAALDAAAVKTIGPANSAAFLENGHLLYLRGSTLIAQRFDEKRLEASPETTPLVTDVAEFTVARDGTLFYKPGGASIQQLTWFDRTGTATGTLGDPGNFFMIELSPDRKKLAVSLDADIWIQDLARGLRSRFTFTPGIDTNPVWSPDGRTIAFASDRSGRYGIYRKSADLSGTEETLYLDNIPTLTDGWSPDGNSLMVHRRDPVDQEDLAFLQGSKLVPFQKTPLRELHGRFSPDGRWVAYLVNESSRDEIFLAPFPGPGPKEQVSTAGGQQPRWRADGKELFFVAANGMLMAADVTRKGDAITVGAAHSLGIRVVNERGWMYDVSADGQRFLVAVRPDRSNLPFTLISNWQLLLKN